MLFSVSMVGSYLKFKSILLIWLSAALAKTSMLNCEPAVVWVWAGLKEISTPVREAREVVWVGVWAR